ncbi:MAG TPA: carboxypeptidase regulatory-like domain-containing protein [Bryobacteraceae bacterium]|nr:carboxypeptidase regulatory-like domain-containing protein [Bryobacteraceae bacterium]
MLAKSRWLLSLGFFSLLYFTSPAWAQITAVEGQVTGADGKPVQNAQILITREDMKGTYKGAKTDKKGHYIYNGLPKGKYTISVLVDGQERAKQEHIPTALGDPTPVNFDLKAGGAEAAAAAAETADRSMSKEEREAQEKRSKANAEAIAKNKALNDSFNAGKEALAAKNWDAAIDAFQKGTQIDPNQHVIWANLADAYIGQASTKTGADQQAALDKGLDAYQKAIALKADDPAYHNNYALALARAKKFDDAQAELNKAAALDPPNAGKYYYNLGALLVNSGQTAASEAAFKKAIEANPDYADAQFQYATALSARLTTGADGKVTAPPGLQEALEKYLALAPTGQYADAAKGMLQMIGAKIQTNYSNPNAKPPAKKK